MSFLPNDFTQVNFELNKKMINLAIDLLDLDEQDNVIDLFADLVTSHSLFQNMSIKWLALKEIEAW